MKKLQVFNDEEFGQVRTMNINGELYFVGTDIVKALGYLDVNLAIEKYVEEEDWMIYEINSQDQCENVTVINESGLYALIFGSGVNTVKRFKRWLTAKVLPSFRKSGDYKTSRQVETSDELLKVRKMNACSRMAQIYMKLSQADTLSDTYRNILVAKACEVLAGEEIIPLPEIEQHKCFSAKQIGEIFDITANKVGRLANQYNLKRPPFGEFRRDKSKYSAHECDTWVYFENVIPEFERIINGKTKKLKP